MCEFIDFNTMYHVSHYEVCLDKTRMEDCGICLLFHSDLELVKVFQHYIFDTLTALADVWFGLLKTCMSRCRKLKQKKLNSA